MQMVGQLLISPQISAEDYHFNDVSVHDPSIIKTEDNYYIIGSHLQFAKSQDLMNWTQLSSSVATTQLFEDVKEELKEDFEYAKTDTLWASDIIQLKDGRYYLYYCLCEGSSPLSVLGVAVADKVEGPYKKIESFIHSGKGIQFDQIYNATKDPNAIDPDVFYDKEGKLWMVYGSYSGGIFILEMDEETGLPLDRNTFGKRLVGGNHSRIEGPFIQYNKDTDYYYLFTSFGGLDSKSGYNIRVARSKSPDGPYEDMEGNLFEDVRGPVNSFFDDKAIEDFGEKLIGNFKYVKGKSFSNPGYISPGHNSTYYDEITDQYYLIFHTRFPHGGEHFEVRVHQLVFLENGWPVVSPLRYTGEELTDFHMEELLGHYNAIIFDKTLDADISEPFEIELTDDNQINGEKMGASLFAQSNLNEDSKIVLNDIEYQGRFISNWDPIQEKKVVTFSGISASGEPLFLIKNEE